MNETDAMKLLAEANPVRMDTIGAVELPDSLFATRRPARRLVLAAALVLLAALAASFIGVFGFAGPRSHSDASNGPVAVTPTPPQPIPLADASAALGAPVVLPDTPLLNASDVGVVTKDCAASGDQQSGCVVSVDFPAQRVSIRYGRYGPPFTDPLPDYEASVADDTFPNREIIYLGGTPAYLTPKAVESPGSGSTISFQVGETTIGIFARNYDGTGVEELAQSIVDRSAPTQPAHGQAALADASAVLGEPVVLPNTSLVSRSDAAPTVSTACPSADQPGAVCQVTVDFPAQALTIRYQRGIHDGKQPPAVSMVRNRYAAVVNHNRVGAELLDLDGTPALFVPAHSSAPPWVEFFVGDVDVLEQGPLDGTALQSVAQSIVDAWAAR